MDEEEEERQFMIKLKEQEHEILYDCISKGDCNSLEIYLSLGLSPNIIDSCGDSILKYSIGLNNPRLIKILINSGANVNYMNNCGRTNFEMFLCHLVSSSHQDIYKPELLKLFLYDTDDDEILFYFVNLISSSDTPLKFIPYIKEFLTVGGANYYLTVTNEEGLTLKEFVNKMSKYRPLYKTFIEQFNGLCNQYDENNTHA